MERAQGLVIAVNDPEAAVRAIRTAHAHAPRLTILARAQYAADRERLSRHGADCVVVAEEAAARELSEQVLIRCGIDASGNPQIQE